MKLYIESPNFVGYTELNLFMSELEHFVSNFQKDWDITQKLIQLCVDSDIGFPPIFETVFQDSDLDLYVDVDGIELYDSDGTLVAHKDFAPKKVITFFYADKKGKTGRRMVEVLEEDDTHVKGVDSDKGEYRQFLKNRMSRIAVVSE